jgi:hypothetical protein
MRAIHPSKRQKFTGRQSVTFLGLPHFVINSPQWAALTGNEVKMLIEIAGQYNGSNNGDLSYPRSRYATRGWSGNDVAHRALTALKAKGWILVTRAGGRTGCSLYAVTFFPMDESSKHPCHREHKPCHFWKQAQARDSDASNDENAVPESGHQSSRNPDTKSFTVRNPDRKIVRGRA